MRAAPFVTMRSAEDDRGENDADDRRSSDGRELPLQVSAKDDLFAEARGPTQAEPHREFEIRTRSQKADLLAHAFDLPGLIQVHGLGGQTQYEHCAHPEHAGVNDVEKEIFQRRPAAADQVAHSACVCECPARCRRPASTPIHRPEILRELVFADDRMAGACAVDGNGKKNDYQNRRVPPRRQQRLAAAGSRLNFVWYLCVGHQGRSIL